MSVESPGLGRRRAGRGFVYLDADGNRVDDAEVLSRCRALVIPPAWQEVWICPDPGGHIQAVGTDDAGRRQYLYHERWRERRERAKHQHVLEMAGRLSAARRHVLEHLALPRLTREKSLAVAFRLLDRGAFRVGGEAYAAQHETYGLATLRKEHLRIGRDGAMEFRYVAKSGRPHVLRLTDEDVLAPLSTLRRRRGGGPELLAYRTGAGTGGAVRWVDVSSADINHYLKELLGPDASAKDFRTWHGTVLAAVTLARSGDPATVRERRSAVRAAVAAVSRQLGNTVAVARGSYIDPKVIDAFERGETIAPTARTAAEIGTFRRLSPAEKAVLDLLG